MTETAKVEASENCVVISFDASKQLVLDITEDVLKLIDNKKRRSCFSKDANIRVIAMTNADLGVTAFRIILNGLYEGWSVNGHINFPIDTIDDINQIVVEFYNFYDNVTLCISC